MIYRKNIGSAQRLLRLLAGLLLALGGFWGLGTGLAGWLLTAAGALTAASGLFGFCPACACAMRLGKGKS
ncbi:MAG: DUF2892 domain-containing protein [Curvibacter sp.]|nr:DUF2892 domain-containing protein [Curvibacter sp.]